MGTIGYGEIYLTQGQKTIVDKDDYEFLSKHKWCAIYSKKRGDYVAVTRTECINCKKRTVYMHREIMRPLKNLHIDHINHNPLDNRKNNLRICTPTENQWNRKGANKNNNTSNYKGICYDLYHKSWKSSIGYHNKSLHIGYFKNKNEAVVAYNQVAIEKYGNYACLNTIGR